MVSGSLAWLYFYICRDFLSFQGGGSRAEPPIGKKSCKWDDLLSVHPSIHLSTRLSAHPSVCPSVCPSVRPSILAGQDGGGMNKQMEKQMDSQKGKEAGLSGIRRETPSLGSFYDRGQSPVYAE